MCRLPLVRREACSDFRFGLVYISGVERYNIIGGETKACVVLSEFPPTISLGFNCRFCF